MALIILRLPPQNRNTGFAKGISADPKDGKLSHGLLLDEYHQRPDKKLYNSIASGRVADPTAMMLIITTAGTELGGVCHQEYEKCKLTESNLVNFQISGDNVFALSRRWDCHGNGEGSRRPCC